MTGLYLLERSGEPFSEALAKKLPPWRQERLAALKNPTARQESLCAGLLLACALERHGLDPALPVALLPAGKPVFSGRANAFFSLSHSGRYVLCAISDRPVGADVQQMRPVNPSIWRRFHPDEQAWLSMLPEQERQAGLFRLWTRKEAWVKAVSADRVLSLSEADVIHGLQGLRFRDYAPPGGYAAAICGADAALPDTLTTISARELAAGTEEENT